MRKKLFLGSFLAAVVAIVAGEYLINRSGAQDAPKKSDEKKSEANLFDILKKDLEAKKDVPPPSDEFKLPPLQPVQAPAPQAPLPTPPKVDDSKSVAPPFPGVGASTQVVPPPTVSPPPLPTPPPPVVDKVERQIKAPSNEPPVPQPKKDDVQNLTFPPPSQTPAAASQGSSVTPPVGSEGPTPNIQPERVRSSGPVQAEPLKIAEQVAKVKDSPWSLQIEVLDGQTIVTATVNKKHEFKIVCQSLDLQTGKHMLKASGKVQISGDALNGTCDHLAISLLNDRLLLEGSAAVSIQKVSMNISDTKPASFELKGETLNLRISELQAARAVHNSFRQVSGDASDGKTVIAELTSTPKQWSSYGTLRRLPNKTGANWCLEDKAGKRILNLVIREGGTLEQYEGQTISVFGTPIDRTTVRVSHIALP